MTKETASFVIQDKDTVKHCLGSELRNKAKTGHIFAVQQNSEIAQHWIYSKEDKTKTTKWELEDKIKLNSDLGLNPNLITGAFEIDMWMTPDFTIYYVYHQYLLKSTDGFNWQIVNDDLPFHAMGHLASNSYEYHLYCSYIDGNAFVYALGHVYKSSDNGVTWKEVIAIPSSYYKDKKNPRIKKAFDKASGTAMLFFAPGKSDTYASKFYYSLDAGETWTLYQPSLPRGVFLEWHDSKQVFLVLTDKQDRNELYSIPMSAFIDNDKTWFQFVKDVTYNRTYNQETFIITPKLIIIASDHVSQGTDYILDHDYNILSEIYDVQTSWNQPRHCTYVLYDPYADDILYGVHRRATNSTSAPAQGRFYLSQLNKGFYGIGRIGNASTEWGDTASMVYHPPTKRYFQAAARGVLYSFEQEPGDVDFIEINETEVITNLDEINDDALFCCTDINGITYSVTGARFKDLFGPPWSGACGIYHVIINNPADINVTNQNAIYNLVTEQEVSTIPAAGEWIITGQDTIFKDSNGNWTFGDLTDTSCVTSMSSLFENAKVFNSDISNWDVSNVENMFEMLFNAQVFNSDISNWDVGNVTNMSHMFYGAKAFNSDISNWDVSNAEDVTNMFFNAQVFNSDISNWDTSNVKKIGAMFYKALAFNSDISNWDVSNATNMSNMFKDTQAFNSDISNWDVSNATNMIYMFSKAKVFNSNISSWDVGNVTNMSYMFQNAQVFNSDVSNWDVGNVSHMGSMFRSAKVFNSDISNWNVSKVTNMSNMFYYAVAFNSDVSNWNVSNVTNMKQLFGNVDVFNSDVSNWNVSNVTNMDVMFNDAKTFNQDLTSWCVTQITSEPSGFKMGSAMPTDGSNDPKWGTCP